ncbi:hypothetical protein [Streptomyces sp. NPDC093111]|uniref:hypothetical protein n=1 Tax=Streptomyces sp. NPDC093111 TaxID=3154978 RepID=UPI00341AFB01
MLAATAGVLAPASSLAAPVAAAESAVLAPDPVPELDGAADEERPTPGAVPAGTDRSVATGRSARLRLPQTASAAEAAEQREATAPQETPAGSVEPAPQSAEETDGQPAAKARWPRPAEFAWRDGPKNLEAGGDWAQAHLILDNSNGALNEGDPYKLSLRIFPVAPKPEDARVQVFLDGAWCDTEPPTPDAGSSVTTLMEGIGFPAERVVIPIRVQVSANVPPADSASIVARLNGPHWQGSTPHSIKITAPDPGSEEPGSGEAPGNGEHSSDSTSDPLPRPEPEQGAVIPADDTAAPVEGRPEQIGTAGALADTGAGEGAAWVLGIGGTVAMIGGAVVAGSGRHRRPQRSR